MSSEYQTLVEDMRDFAKAIEALAFKMPPPNAFTPQFVQLAQAAKRIADQADERRKSKGRREL